MAAEAHSHQRDCEVLSSIKIDALKFKELLVYVGHVLMKPDSFFY